MAAPLLRALGHVWEICLVCLAACGPALAQVSSSAPRPAPPSSGAASAPRAAARSAASVHRSPARNRKGKASRPVHEDAEPDSFVYGRRPDVMAFADEVAADRGLDRDWVQAQLARARYLPAVARLVMPAPPGVAKNWAAYRARFLDPQRLRAGLSWWQAHEADLARAQIRYGVPPEIVAGIVGVESYWGRLTGRFRVLDALSTLAFDFPAGRSDRSAFYRSELRAYLAWCALEDREADGVQGSYAGAIGWPQFMPSSILRFAVDFDGDGHVDLTDGGADVIGSVANFLALQGWQRGEPTHFAVGAPSEPAERARLLAPDIMPTFTADELVAHGAALPQAVRAYPGRLAFIRLDNGTAAPTYVAGTQNFFVITRYNWSAYYAMAVIELGAALRAEFDRDREAQRGNQAPSSERQAQP